MINIGGNISEVCVGSTKIAEAYVGSQLVYENSSEDPVITRLKQLGCIMWFPLDEQNGLNDVIGGKTLHIVRSGSIVWSSAYGLYYVVLNNKGVVVADINVDWNQSDFVNNGWTTITQVRRYTNSSYRGASNVFKTNHSGTAVSYNLILMGMNGAGTAHTENWTDDILHTTAFVCSTAGRKIYHGTTKIVDDAVVYQHPWGCSKFNMTAYDAWTGNKRCFIKNDMLFNKMLSEDEIAEVYSLIGLN